MRKTVVSVVFYLAIAVMALALNNAFAKSSVPSFTDGGWVLQGAPTFVDGAWVMPPRPVASLMQYSGYGGYEAEIANACAYWGCSPDYLIGVMMCESGGDHGAVAYNPSSGNYTYGIFQIDGMWGGGGMTPAEQIWFAAEHLTKGDIWWSCG
jgi:hypothetical protein